MGHRAMTDRSSFGCFDEGLGKNTGEKVAVVNTSTSTALITRDKQRLLFRFDFLVDWASVEFARRWVEIFVGLSVLLNSR
jgi:hypothetical protein